MSVVPRNAQQVQAPVAGRTLLGSGTEGGAEDTPEDDVTPGNAMIMVVEDLRTEGGTSGSVEERLPASDLVGATPPAFYEWSMDLDPHSGFSQEGGQEVEQAEEEGEGEPETRRKNSIPAPSLMNDVIPATGLMSNSPPPSYSLERERHNRKKGEAIRETRNELTETLFNMSISTALAERYDKERMRKMVAQLQGITPSWEEAIGQKQPGAAQKR